VSVHRRGGRFTLDEPPELAIRAFTARGEQGWVPGWVPVLHGDAADDPAADDTEPGTVFETEVDGRHTVWVVVDRRPAEYLRYARVATGRSAGTVEVTLTARPDGGTTVEVAYELTALGPDGERQLCEDDADPGAAVELWREPVAAYLRGLAEPPSTRPS
jgi:hypothetical protein